MDYTIDQLLAQAVEQNASDIHLKVGSPPVLRIEGTLLRVSGLEALTPSDTERFAQAIFTQKAATQFKETNEAEFAYGRQDLGRFRVSAYRQRGSVSMVLRRVVPGVPSLDRLGLPPIVRRLAAEERGLVLVTGPSGSGRTTTVAAIVEHINQERGVSIITVEDPIEILFPDQKAIIAQREVGVDAPSFGAAITKATKQDADVIMVSEINDEEAAMAVVAAAETGHLVIGAMHTQDPIDTIQRLISLFPPAKQATARSQIAAQLKGIISQRLLDTADGTGRVLATEVLTGNPKMSELIRTGGDAEALLDVVRESEFFGMQTFDDALFTLVKNRRVTVSDALPFVRKSHEFRAKAMEAGLDI